MTKLLKRFEAVGAASLFDQGLSADGRTGTSNRPKVVFSEHPRSITILLQDRLCMNAPNSALGAVTSPGEHFIPPMDVGRMTTAPGTADCAPSGADAKRSVDLVLVVPGLDVRGPGEALDRLIEGIRRYRESCPKQWLGHHIATRLAEGVTQATMRVVLGDGTEYWYDIRELAWADLRPSMKDVSVYRRLLRGARLVSYWAPPLFRRMPSTSNGLRGWFFLGVILLFVWYSAALVAACQTLSPYIPDWIAGLHPALAVKAKPSGWLLVAVLGLLGVKVLTDGVDGAWSTYAFMADRESLRRKLRLRLRGMLSCFANDAERYRRIVLVAHSLGTAVAVDALAEREIDGFRVPPLDLITLGSPLEFLALCGPEIQTSVDRCLNAVRSWSDFYAPKDAFCSRVPLMDLLEQKFQARQISLGYSWFDSLIGRAHNAYFDDPEVLTRILDTCRSTTVFDMAAH